MIYGNMYTHEYGKNGTKPQIMTELTSLIHTLYKVGELTKEDVKEICRVSVMEKEELKKEVDEVIKSTECADVVIAIQKIVTDAANGDETAKEILKLMLENNI